MKIKTRRLSLQEQKQLIYMQYCLISIISNPYSQIIEYCVKKNSENIKYINNPSKSLQLSVINKSSWSIRFIKNPCKEVQMKAVMRNPSLITIIKNPCQEAVLSTMVYNLDLDDDFIIECLEKNSGNISLLNFISEKVENFILEKMPDLTRYILNPSKRIQVILANKNECKLDNPGICKEALKIIEEKFLSEFEPYSYGTNWYLREFLCQHNLDISPESLYTLLKNYETKLEPYLSYDIVDKLLEINPFDVNKYNIKEPSLLEKYKKAKKISDIGLI